MPAALGHPPDRQRCKGCGLCVEHCPFGRLVLDTDLNEAGYHPAVVADRPPDGNGARYPGRSAESPGADERTGGAFLSHNVAFWCSRCRYCELICPDAAVRIPGSAAGLEGAPTDGGGRA